MLPRPTANPKCGVRLWSLYLTSRSLDERDGRARWVTRWKPALTAYAITPSKAASRPMNTTRPNQINRLPIGPASSVFHEGCESRWLLILGPRRLSA